MQQSSNLSFWIVASASDRANADFYHSVRNISKHHRIAIELVQVF